MVSGGAETAPSSHPADAVQSPRGRTRTVPLGTEAGGLWPTVRGTHANRCTGIISPGAASVKRFVSYPIGIVSDVLCGLDLDGVLCDLGPPVAARIARRFGVATHPAAWSRYDLRLLDLGLPEAPF